MFKVSLDTDKKITLLIVLFLAEWFIDKLVMLGFFLYFTKVLFPSQNNPPTQLQPFQLFSF